MKVPHYLTFRKINPADSVIACSSQNHRMSQYVHCAQKVVFKDGLQIMLNNTWSKSLQYKTNMQFNM